MQLNVNLQSVIARFCSNAHCDKYMFMCGLIFFFVVLSDTVMGQGTQRRPVNEVQSDSTNKSQTNVTATTTEEKRGCSHTG